MEQIPIPEVPRDEWIRIQRSILEMAIPEDNNEKRLEWANLHGERCRELWDEYKDADPKPTPKEMAGVILQKIQAEEGAKE